MFCRWQPHSVEVRALKTFKADILSINILLFVARNKVFTVIVNMIFLHYQYMMSSSTGKQPRDCCAGFDRGKKEAERYRLFQLNPSCLRRQIELNLGWTSPTPSTPQEHKGYY